MLSENLFLRHRIWKLHVSRLSRKTAAGRPGGRGGGRPETAARKERGGGRTQKVMGADGCSLAKKTVRGGKARV